MVALALAPLVPHGLQRLRRAGPVGRPYRHGMEARLGGPADSPASERVWIPVLHGVSFGQVAEYSGILPDLAGFETSRDSVEVIAQKIAAALVAE